MISCPRCDRTLMSGDTENGRIRTRLVLIENGRLIVVCPQCKDSQELPLKVTATPGDEKKTKPPIRHVVLPKEVRKKPTAARK